MFYVKVVAGDDNGDICGEEEDGEESEKAIHAVQALKMAFFCIDLFKSVNKLF